MSDIETLEKIKKEEADAVKLSDEAKEKAAKIISDAKAKADAIRGDGRS